MSGGMLFASLNGSRRCDRSTVTGPGPVTAGLSRFFLTDVPPVEWRWLYWLLCSAPSIAGLIVILIQMRRKR